MAIMRVRNDDGSISEITVIKGKDGKSAYQYALDSGYIGTEAEFAAKLIKDGPEAFYVDILDNGDMTGTISRPYDEIMEAFNAGSSIVGTIYIDSETAAGNIIFGDFGGMLMGTCTGYNANGEAALYAVVIYEDNGVSCMGVKINPESLPSPNKLIINDGNSNVEYDGSSEISIKIPKNAEDVNADSAGTAETKVSNHNTSTDAHNDIRLSINNLISKLNSIADSDDTTLDQLSELVKYIKENRGLIESVTTGKVSVSDIVDNLTTNVSNKPLSAAAGVALKALIDAKTVPSDSHINSLIDAKLAAITNAEEVAF